MSGFQKFRFLWKNIASQKLQALMKSLRKNKSKQNNDHGKKNNHSDAPLLY